MNKLECIVSDLDESLLGADGLVGPQDLETIRTLKAKGVYFFIATGRHFSLARQLAWQVGLDMPVICCNGGHVYDFTSGATLMARDIEPAAAAAMKDYLDSLGRHYLIYTPEAPYFTADNPRLPFWQRHNEVSEPENRATLYTMDSSFHIGDHRILKFLIPGADLAMRERLNAFNSAGKLEIQFSGKGLLDVNAAGASKGGGITFLSQHFGFSLENTVALGDSDNDRSMLEVCGYPVVPQNGQEDLRAMARFVTSHHNDSPLTHAVEHLFPGLI